MTKVFDRRHQLVLVLCALATSGCAGALDMRERGGQAPHASIPYTGVRNDAARFADYSVVDASILK